MKNVIPFANQSKSRMRQRGKYSKGWPVGAVVHFTAGRDGAQKTIDGGVKQGFTYLCIQKDGAVVQAHDVDQWGYHAGESAWGSLAKAAYEKLGLSKLFKPLSGSVSDDLIGIEINAAGRVDKLSDGTFRTWFKTIVKAEDVREAKADDANIQKGFYEKYTLSQEKTLVLTLFWLKGQAPNIFDFAFVIGHDECAGKMGIGKSRKNDPGAALPCTMIKFREYLVDQYPKFAAGGDFVALQDWLQGVKAPTPVVAAPKPKPEAKPTSQASSRDSKFVSLALAKSAEEGREAARMVALWHSKYPGKNPRYRAIMNVSLKSSKKRFRLYDCEAGSVKEYLGAHGKGSDKNNDGVADKFSNENGSNCTSLGIYRCAETSECKTHGHELRVDGLESTNSNARKRAILVHRAIYVNELLGIAGRTLGCIGLDPSKHREVIDALKDGSPLSIYRG